MNTHTLTHAQIITWQELKSRTRAVPASWRKAAGMLKGRDAIDPVQYQKDIRTGWEERLRKQIALAPSPHGH